MHCYRYTILLLALLYIGKVALVSREIEPKQDSSASKLLSLKESVRIKRKGVYRPDSAFRLNYRHWIKLEGGCQDHILGR